MAKSEDEAAQIASPRLLSAAYFALLSIVATILIKGSWHLIDMRQFIPIFQAILLGAAIAAIFGALFGERIVHCKKPYRLKTFLYGLLMALIALPFYVLFYALLIHLNNPSFFLNNELTSPFTMYAFIFIYSFFTTGWWVAILTGFAAMLLRGHFVYDILHTDNGDSQKSNVI